MRNSIQNLFKSDKRDSFQPGYLLDKNVVTKVKILNKVNFDLDRYVSVPPFLEDQVFYLYTQY